jgi:hypothetical protein
MAVSFTGPVKNRVRPDGNRSFFSGLPVGLCAPELVIYNNDFVQALDYSTSNFTLTAVGSGTAAVNGTSNEVNGILLLTNSAADDDSLALQSKQEAWKIVVGKQMWFEVGAAISDATESDFLCALAITDTTPMDATDYIGFLKADGSTSVNAKTVFNSTATTTAVATMNTSQNQYGWHWDGASKIDFYINRNLMATHTTNIVNDEDLAICIMIQNGEAVAKTCSIDYIFVAKER